MTPDERERVRQLHEAGLERKPEDPAYDKALSLIGKEFGPYQVIVRIGGAVWVKSTVPVTPGSAVMWRSKSCPIWLQGMRLAFVASPRRPARLRCSITRTFSPFMTSGNTKARLTS